MVRRAAIKLQAFGRMIIERRMFARKLFSLLMLQTFTRNRIAYHRYRHQLRLISQLQRLFKVYLTRKKYLAFKRAVIIVQCFFRMTLGKLIASKRVRSILLCQRFISGSIVRLGFLKMKVNSNVFYSIHT